VESFQILEVKGRTCSCQLGTGYSRVIREIKFETTPEVESFQRALEKVKRLEDERGQRQLQLFREIQRKKKIKASEKADDVSDDKEIAILGEIVSAKSLPIADIISTDPYVIVQLGTNEIHRTKILSRTLDPIWTLQTGSLFLIRMAPEDFFRNGGMVFVVKDFDQIGANETLGTVRVPLTDILEKVGEREEYSIEPSKQFRKSITKKGSKLNLRFREASEDDIKVSLLRPLEMLLHFDSC
jgi:Ca2+-dependent lipid-binding protein